MKIDGACHCGHIAYQAEVDPNEVYVCHCTDCQTISGSAFRWAVPIAEEAFALVKGEPKTYIKKAESGAMSHQLFCPECASPLYSISIGGGPQFFNLRLGPARQRAELRLKSQHWCRSAQHWVTDLDQAAEVDTT